MLPITVAWEALFLLPMKHLTPILVFSLLPTAAIFARELDSRIQLLPQPQQITVAAEGSYTSQQLSQLKPRLWLTLTDVPKSDEGYRLTIDAQGISICSRGEAGLFYGQQTLQQLMTDSREQGVDVPWLTINDWPDIDYRAVHFDTKHHLNTLSEYYAEIDRLAHYKINAVIWEIEDKLAYWRQPEIAAPGAISRDEMQSLCRYAHERHVAISPLVQGLGHASFILKHHPELRESPGSDWEFCPSNPATYDLQFALYADALEAMPYGQYLHVGGDEVSRIGVDERCRQSGMTPFELQMLWLRRVCDFAISHGRTPIFWDDMPLKYGQVWDIVNSQTLTTGEVASRWNDSLLTQAKQLFPRECIYMRWLYADPTHAGNQRVMKWYSDSGLRVMGATAAAYGNSPFLPREQSLAANIRGFCQLVAQNGLEGILATCWDDGSPHIETVWRGFLALSDFSWNASRSGRDIGSLLTAHAQREYGLPAHEGLTAFIDTLELMANFFDGALVDKGRRNPAWGITSFELITLPDASAPGAWSEHYAARLQAAHVADKRYQAFRAGITEAMLRARHRLYNLEVYEQTGELMHYPVRLLLALEAFDNATAETREAALLQLQQVCDDFWPMRSTFEEVYGRVRPMQQPEGYLPDSNYHNHLAAKTLTSEWWYLYELPMIGNIRTTILQ